MNTSAFNESMRVTFKKDLLNLLKNLSIFNSSSKDAVLLRNSDEEYVNIEDVVYGEKYEILNWNDEFFLGDIEISHKVEESDFKGKRISRTVLTLKVDNHTGSPRIFQFFLVDNQAPRFESFVDYLRPKDHVNCYRDIFEQL